MKYQFQLAGANVSRRSSPQKKAVRIAILTVVGLVAVGAYWQYLHHLTRGSNHALQEEAATVVAATATTAAARTSATATTVTAAAAKTATTVSSTAVAAPMVDTKPAPAATEAPLVPALKKATESTIAAVDNALTETVKISPAAPVPTTIQPTPVTTATPVAVEPVTKPLVAPVSVPMVRVTSVPPVSRPTLVHTPEQRLMRAGITAFDNAMDMATKYPDAYGFGPTDAYKDAKLGDPIPVYTISDSDRAKYQSGQPLKPLLKPSNLWVFPVLMGNRVCCMVQVKYSGHDYVPENGSKSLGIAWNKILEKWPASAGYHPCVVVNPAIPGYFFTIPELPTPNLTDIINLSNYQPSLSPADVILASWR